MATTSNLVLISTTKGKTVCWEGKQESILDQQQTEYSSVDLVLPSAAVVLMG
jgi:hypothetical protein